MQKSVSSRTNSFVALPVTSPHLRLVVDDATANGDGSAKGNSGDADCETVGLHRLGSPADLTVFWQTSIKGEVALTCPRSDDGVFGEEPGLHIFCVSSMTFPRMRAAILVGVFSSVLMLLALVGVEFANSFAALSAALCFRHS